MRSFFICIIMTCSLSSYNQESVESIRKAIDTQVWYPFHDAFENLNPVGLNELYAEDVIRVTPAGLDTEEVFKKTNVVRFNKNKKDGIKILLDFWFESRDTDATTSYEVGFFKITSTDNSGVSRETYGQFHIVIKQIEGVWKITQDYDTTELNG